MLAFVSIFNERFNCIGRIFGILTSGVVTTALTESFLAVVSFFKVKSVIVVCCLLPIESMYSTT